jgi:glyoxylase-like metal-dependent hydrolase (beta-lactamase superfamily II)
MSGRLVVGSQEPWESRSVSDRSHCVLAANPGPMTLDGTNTWILVEPGGNEAIVVDPGPDDDAHLHAVLREVQRHNARVVATLLTHGHLDHSAGARTFHMMTNAPVHALDPAHRFGSEGLNSGDVVAAGELEVRVVATPGHTSDSICFSLPADGAILTGDTILGRGTTVVAWPDGDLGAYLQSLTILADVAATTEARVLLPGHGPMLQSPAQVITDYVTHRQERLAQVRAAVAAGAKTAADIVRLVYDDIPEEVRPAAEMSAQAQLDYLNSRN